MLVRQSVYILYKQCGWIHGIECTRSVRGGQWWSIDDKNPIANSIALAAFDSRVASLPFAVTLAHK